MLGSTRGSSIIEIEMKRIILLFVFVFTLLLTSLGLAENIYVSQSGGGDGSSCVSTQSASWFNTSGNWANPKVSGKIGPGDTVYFCGTITTDLHVQKSGSDGNYIVLDGSTATNLNLKFFIESVSYITLQNAPFYNLADNHDAIHLTTTSYVLVQNNHVENCGGRPLFLEAGHDHVTIKNNFLQNAIGNADLTTENDVIGVHRATNLIIEGNYLYDQSANTNHVDTIQTWCTFDQENCHDWDIRYNMLILDAGGDPDKSWLMFSNIGANFYAYGNVFIGVSGASGAIPFQFSSTGAYETFTYNNTFVSKTGVHYGCLYAVGPWGDYKNNIYYQTESTSNMYCTSGSNTFSYQDAYQAAGSNNSPSCTGCIQTDPLFVNYAANDFSLQSASPARGTGTNLGSGGGIHTFDYGIAPGAKWPNPTLVQRTGNWDMGAYVYVPPSNQGVIFQGVKLQF